MDSPAAPFTVTSPSRDMITWLRGADDGEFEVFVATSDVSVFLLCFGIVGGGTLTQTGDVLGLAVTVLLHMVGLEFPVVIPGLPMVRPGLPVVGLALLFHIV